MNVRLLELLKDLGPMVILSQPKIYSYLNHLVKGNRMFEIYFDFLWHVDLEYIITFFANCVYDTLDPKT